MEQLVTTQARPRETVASARNGAAQYLSFRLGQETYAVEILGVQEIRGLSPITPIPNAPAHVRGVMNLRGTIVPVIDLRIRFSVPDASYHRFTVIIIVAVASHVVGLVVDAVSDVVSADAEHCAPPPDFGARVDTSFITGLLQSGEQLVMLLNLERLLGDDAQNLTLPPSETKE